MKTVLLKHKLGIIYDRLVDLDFINNSCLLAENFMKMDRADCRSLESHNLPDLNSMLLLLSIDKSSKQGKHIQIRSIYRVQAVWIICPMHQFNYYCWGRKDLEQRLILIPSPRMLRTYACHSMPIQHLLIHKIQLSISCL